MGEGSYYELLGIPRTATEDDIRSAVRKQRSDWTRRQAHPKVEIRHEAEVRVRAITDAEHVLTDSGRRRSYDMTLGPGRVPAVVPVLPTPAPRPQPSPPPSPVEDEQAARLAEAEDLLSRGEWRAAHAAATEVTTRGAGSREGWCLRAEASLQLSDTSTADDEASRLTALHPSAARHWAVIAHVHVEHRRWAHAADAYRRASELDPHEADYSAGEADMHIVLDRPELAVPILERLVAERSSRPELRELLAIALLDDTVARWTLDDGERFVTTDEQLAHTTGVLRRVKRLGAHSPEIDAQLQQVAAWLRQGWAPDRADALPGGDVGG